MTQKEEIENVIVKALGELEQIPVEISEKPHTTMMEALSLVKNLDISLVSVAVFCHAPEHIKPCRHGFSDLCQYNGHCNFKKTER